MTEQQIDRAEGFSNFPCAVFTLLNDPVPAGANARYEWEETGFTGTVSVAPDGKLTRTDEDLNPYGIEVEDYPPITLDPDGQKP